MNITFLLIKFAYNIFLILLNFVNQIIVLFFRTYIVNSLAGYKIKLNNYLLIYKSYLTKTIFFLQYFIN